MASLLLASTGRFAVVDTGAAAAPSTATAATTSGADTDDGVDALHAQCTRQAGVVKLLKKDGAAPEKIAAGVAELLALRAALAAAQASAGASAGDDADATLHRAEFDQLMVKRMFVVPSFEIHSGVKGLFDFGPPGCAVKSNVIEAWKRHFVLEESMLEMECTCLTPENVLKTSGHVEKFTDLMVKDPESGECFRADKILEDAIDRLIESEPGMSASEKEQHELVQRQADAYTPDEIDELILKYKIVSPQGRALTKSYPFNLMFRTTIGPEGTSVGYLRPETAQGLFVNFRRLLDFNGGRMPLAAAQVGLGFRNEISPRAGLLRVREFTMAEIEHFVNPNNKAHPKFASVKGVVMTLFSNDAQLSTGKVEKVAIGDAVARKLVDNETLGYFMARTQLFCKRVGMDMERVRFRQHLATEMAHYAADCWDLEIKSSYGWVECAGHADRSCYDLKVHGEKTNVSMEASERLAVPRVVDVVELAPDKKLIGKTFKKDQKAVYAILDALCLDDAAVAALEAALAADGEAKIGDGAFTVTSQMVKFTRKQKKIDVVKYMPSVIEPSFGIGRILYSLLEHAFFKRKGEGDDERRVLRFAPSVAPVKCGVYSTQSSKATEAFVGGIAAALTAAGMSNKPDTSGVGIGRKYARADELGTPLGVTVDAVTLSHKTVTLRERDSTAQVRVPVDELPRLVAEYVAEKWTWADAMQRWPVVSWGEDALGNKIEAPETAAVVEDTGRGRFHRPKVPIVVPSP